ncbi:MAG: phosphoglycolate phosphatase [Rhodothalassiaceae bacterium]|nr:MAG: phosphoglycolate phosphatase [Rhodothalassiaceae bacterium]
MFRARTVIFDLDGTLVDTAPDLAAAANRILALYGRPPLAMEALRRFVGGGARLLLQRAFAATGAPVEDALLEERILPAFLAAYEARIAALSRPYPGVVETLEALSARGHVLAVATNKPQHLTEKLLAELSLAPLFAAIVGRDAAPRPKPDRAHLDHALALSGNGGPAVMVGDSATDVAAARAAGMPVLVVPYGYAAEPAGALGADAVLADFPSLLERLLPA